MAVHVPRGVHRHERRDLHEAGIDPPPGAGMAARHGGDQVLLEPVDRAGRGELVDLGRVDPGVDRAGHQGHARRMRRVAALGHHGGGRQRLHAGLAHRHHVGARAHRLEELHQVGDVVVEPEAAGAHRHVAGVVPVGDVDVVIGQQGAHGAAQQRGEVAREGGTTSTRGCSLAMSLRKRRSVPNGVESTRSSVTGVSRLPTRTDSIRRPAGHGSGRPASSSGRRPTPSSPGP